MGHAQELGTTLLVVSAQCMTFSQVSDYVSQEHPPPRLSLEIAEGSSLWLLPRPVGIN
jgi:hypothetical protein